MPQGGHDSRQSASRPVPVKTKRKGWHISWAPRAFFFFSLHIRSRVPALGAEGQRALNNPQLRPASSSQAPPLRPPKLESGKGGKGACRGFLGERDHRRACSWLPAEGGRKPARKSRRCCHGASARRDALRQVPALPFQLHLLGQCGAGGAGGVRGLKAKGGGRKGPGCRLCKCLCIRACARAVEPEL